MNRRQKQLEYRRWLESQGRASLRSEVTDEEVIRAIKSVPEHFAPITEVFSTSAVSSDSGGSVTTPTSGIDSSTSGFVAVAVSDYAGASLGTVLSRDAHGPTALTSYTDGASVCRSTIYYFANYSGRANDYWQYSGGTTFPSIAVIGFSAVVTSSPYDSGTNHGAGNTGLTNLQTGSASPSQGGDVLLAALAVNSGASDTYTIDSSFHIQEHQANVAANALGITFAYLIQTSASAVNPKFSWQTSQGAAATIAAFKAASPPAGGTGAPILSGGILQSSIVRW